MSETEDDDTESIEEQSELKYRMPQPSGELSEEEAIARVTVSPALGHAATLVRSFSFYSSLEFNALVKELNHQTALIKSNDLCRGEEMLSIQAHTLDALFRHLIERSHRNSQGGYLDASENYMKLALRAQAQCRCTWEAVASIKNPPVVGYAKQANFGLNQQVNNQTPAGNQKNPPNELSGGTDELHPDTRAPSLEKQADSTLETLGAVDRADNDSGKGEGSYERVQRG